MKNKDSLIAVLKDEIEAMDNAVKVLSESYSRCQGIIKKRKFSIDESEKFEALTSRFARLSDILLQKVWRSLFIAELEEDGTPRDRMNKAEKKGLIDDANEFIELRKLRNKIAHNYTLVNIRDTYKQVLIFAPILLEATQKLREYVIKKNLI